MIEYVGHTTIKATGQRVIYLYKYSWGRKYYSFDGGKTWKESKIEAYKSKKEV